MSAEDHPTCPPAASMSRPHAQILQFTSAIGASRMGDRCVWGRGRGGGGGQGVVVTHGCGARRMRTEPVLPSWRKLLNRWLCVCRKRNVALVVVTENCAQQVA
jgi:hypothetical protein